MQTRCSAHRDRDVLPRACPICNRIDVENAIVTRLVDALLTAGFTLQIEEDEPRPIIPTRARVAILAELGETDEDVLHVFDRHSRRPRYVRLAYGNDGWDVIGDYSTSLEQILAPVNEYAKSMA